MAKSNRNEKEYYSFILINKKQRFGLILTLCFSFAVFMFIIARAIFAHRAWVDVLLPVILFGLPIFFYPTVQMWIYRPWQATARKYEQDYLD
ncbi:MAG: hypothetical protein HYW48_04175 [Deltaproteobacteria bacterium]|nr:hypothetical protein [Deltaproteobacteria bacterium]